MKIHWRRMQPMKRLAVLVVTVLVFMTAAAALALVGLHSPADEPATAATPAIDSTPTPAASSTTTEPPAAHGGREDCTVCHVAAHNDRGACTTCHKRPGETWAFDHPKSSDCVACHKAPADHYGSECSKCHTRSVGFKTAKVTHQPSMDCLRCHQRPHRDRGSCAGCHRPGVSWSFRHPSRTDCASCHRAPATHYGTKCSSCHSPSRSFGSATFRHPSIPGGEHTYRSFACVNCHPSSYSSRTCAKCHDSASGPSDD